MSVKITYYESIYREHLSLSDNDNHPCRVYGALCSADGARRPTWEQAFAEDWRKTKSWQPGWEYVLD